MYIFMSDVDKRWQVVSQTYWPRSEHRSSSRHKILRFTTTKRSFRQPTAAKRSFRM